MLSIRNLTGAEEPFIDFKGLRRKRKINGEKTISLTIFNSKSNEHAFDLIEEESTIFFDDDEYIIKVMSEKAIGKTTIKHVEAIHKFYVDLINKQQPLIHNGSITFQDYMELVFEDTGYTFIAIDPFYARSFENLGDDNRLNLLKKGLERFKAEMELVGNQVRFRQQVGNDSDFQFRYAHNIKTIERKVETTNLATVIRGKGDPELGIEEYYRSDNADIFGEIDAPSVSDERFKSNEALLEEMIGRLQDTPEFSITIDFIELRAAGYPYTIPNEGDSVFVIYEPMQDLMIDTRILEIEEEFNTKLEPIKTNVTLANYKKSFAGTSYDNTQKQLGDLINDDGVIKYNALDEAIRIATEALQSAQTELIFENGIIARDKNNPNRVVVYNSEGIGISDDGGQTFREAVTSDGFVLSAGAIGRLAANHIQIGPETYYEDGSSPYETYLKSIESEYRKMKAEFEVIENSEYVEDSLKLIALLVFEGYDVDYFRLKNTIEGAIANGIISEEDKNAIDDAISEYTSTLENTIKVKDMVVESMPVTVKEELKDDLNLTAPLPTSISMNSSGITASTSLPNRYARLDYRGLYIAGGAIQIDGGLSDNQIENSSKWNSQGTYIDQYGVYTGSLTANQIRTGFNNIGSQVSISASGLTTYSGGLRTSLLNGSGHSFYREGTSIGMIGTTAWANDPNYRGLIFNLETESDYMAWAYREPGETNPYVRFIWHKTANTKGNKGFTFSDDVTIEPMLYLGYSQQASLNPFTNAVRLEFGNQNITLYDDGQVAFRTGSSSNHVFFPGGTKNGGSIRVDDKKLGMSPIDSPQILIEYIEFDVELSPFGTKIMLDETYLKTVSSFAAFSNNGELVEKGSDYIVIKGEGLADIRIVGKRVKYENVFWGDMDSVKEVVEVDQRKLASTRTT